MLVVIVPLRICHLILRVRSLVKVGADERRRSLISLVWYLVIVSLVRDLVG